MYQQHMFRIVYLFFLGGLHSYDKLWPVVINWGHRTFFSIIIIASPSYRWNRGKPEIWSNNYLYHSENTFLSFLGWLWFVWSTISCGHIYIYYIYIWNVQPTIWHLGLFGNRAPVDPLVHHDCPSKLAMNWCIVYHMLSHFFRRLHHEELW